jgi:hypothetical protein
LSLSVTSYSCLVTNGGTIATTADTLKFATYWIGTVDTAWENPLNWSCGQVPDKNTDVTLNAGVPNYPVINSNAICRSLTELFGIRAKVNSGYSFTLTGSAVP